MQEQYLAELLKGSDLVMDCMGSNTASKDRL